MYIGAAYPNCSRYSVARSAQTQPSNFENIIDSCVRHQKHLLLPDVIQVRSFDSSWQQDLIRTKKQGKPNRRDSFIKPRATTWVKGHRNGNQKVKSRGDRRHLGCATTACLRNTSHFPLKAQGWPWLLSTTSSGRTHSIASLAIKFNRWRIFLTTSQQYFDKCRIGARS